MGVSLSFLHMGDQDWQQGLFPTEPTHHPTPPQSFLLVNSTCFLAESPLVASQLIPSRRLEAWHWTLTYKALCTSSSLFSYLFLLPQPLNSHPLPTMAFFLFLQWPSSSSFSWNEPSTFLPPNFCTVIPSLGALSFRSLRGLHSHSFFRPQVTLPERCEMTTLSTATQSCAVNCVFL